MQKLRTQLQKVKEIEEAHNNEIINLVTDNNLLSDLLSDNSVLRSNNRRRLYFKQNFCYTESVEYVFATKKFFFNKVY